MSIYGGFPTRQLETTYNDTLLHMLQQLQQEVLRAGNPDPLFVQAFSKLHRKLLLLECNKHLEPKFGAACASLSKFLKGESEAR
jgi:hypothetical protein